MVYAGGFCEKQGNIIRAWCVSIISYTLLGEGFGSLFLYAEYFLVEILLFTRKM